jgi:hypothetical protein
MIGILGQHLSKLIQHDLINFNLRMRDEKLERYIDQKNTVGTTIENVSPRVVHAPTKQKPFTEPKSEMFFEALRKIDVQKCLSMIMKNQKLVNDCDGDRKTPMHWACQNDAATLV